VVGYCLILGDRSAENLLEKFSWVLIAFAAISDRAGRAWKKFGGAFGLTLIISAVCLVTGRFSVHPSEVTHNFFRYMIPVLWLAGLCLALPVIIPGPRKTRTCRCRNRSIMVILIWAFAVTSSISASASLFPKQSMKLLGAEVLPYAALFTIAVRLWDHLDQTSIRAAIRACWLITVVACFGMVLTLAAFFAGGPARSWLLQHTFFRVDSDAPGVFRLQYLFEHHNRCGFYAAVAVFLCLAGAWGRPIYRWLGVAGACCAAIALPFTLTRGALLAAICGGVFFLIAAAVRGRMKKQVLGAIAALIALGAIAAPFVLPARYEKHIAKMAEPEYYSGSVPNSISARFIIWKVALGMIGRRPVLGFGYGFENFESTARLEHPQIPNFFKDAVHAHNDWLETAAEQGILGMAVLFLWTIIRIGLLALVWWKTAEINPSLAKLLLLWLSLEVVIQVYGMGNYALRRNLGHLAYIIWAGSIGWIALARQTSHNARQKSLSVTKLTSLEPRPL
jgi:O-antigen ligase